MYTYELNTFLKQYFLHVTVFITRYGGLTTRLNYLHGLKLVLLVQPSSAAAERASSLENSFSHQQKCIPLKFMFLGQ